MLFLIIVFVIGNSLAAIYTWLDENNEIHYSDKHPKGKSFQEIQPPRQPTPEDIEQAKNRQEKIEEHLNKETNEREDQQEKCDQARTAAGS